MRYSRFPFMLVMSLLLLIPSGVGGCATTPSSSNQGGVGAPPMTFVLVRHAERLNDSADSPLSMTGVERTRRLVSMLRDAELSGVFSTNYQRTRGTAAPVAAVHGVDVDIYDPRDLDGFAAQIRRRGGRVLVVGHSNTTHELVDLLGGDAGAPINDAREYDRLYVLTMHAGGRVDTVLLRY